MTIYNLLISHNDIRISEIKAPFINADLIQKQELDDQSMQCAYAAAKIAEQRRQMHLQNQLVIKPATITARSIK